MGLFDRFKRKPKLPPLGTKASAIGRLIYLQALGRPAWTERNYEQLAREGFVKNAIIYRCIRLVSESAASVPFFLRNGDTEIDTHPLLTLMQRPNPEQDGASFMEAWYGFLLASGNCYTEAVSGIAAPRELYNLRPDRMQVELGPQGQPSGYVYRANGQEHRFPNDPVTGKGPILHVKLFNPVSDYYGLSPIEAAAYATDIHNAGSGWNKALLDNAARPSGALVYKGHDNALSLTEEQYGRLKAEMETNYEGGGNAGRPLLLDGGLEWVEMFTTPKDLDFVEGKNQAAREIALAFGVPPMLLGIPGDNTYSTYREANLVFWRTTVLPLVAKAVLALNYWLVPMFKEKGLEIAYDADAVPALALDRDQLFSRLDKASFLTMNEKRAIAGYGPIDGGDVIVAPAASLPLDLTATPGQQGDGAPPSDAQIADLGARRRAGQKPGQ